MTDGVTTEDCFGPESRYDSFLRRYFSALKRIGRRPVGPNDRIPEDSERHSVIPREWYVSNGLTGLYDPYDPDNTVLVTHSDLVVLLLCLYWHFSCGRHGSDAETAGLLGRKILRIFGKVPDNRIRKRLAYKMSKAMMPDDTEILEICKALRGRYLRKRGRRTVGTSD